MSNKANRGVGPVPEGLSEGLADFLGQVRRIMIDVQAGRVATLQLPGSTGGTSGGGGSSGGGTGGGTGGTYEPDLTPPPTPTVFNAVAGMDFVGLTTEAPTFTQGHGYLATIVYGAKYAGSGPEPTFANAVQVHDFIGEVGTFPTDPATVWHLWAKWKTRDGVLSNAPAGGANGVRVTTGQDVTRLMTALAGKVKNEQLDPTSNFIFRANLFTIAPAAGGLPNVLPFSVLTTPTLTAAGELLPAGTYIDAAYIRNLEAALGRFQNAFITNAMIVSVSASRITSGVISVGNYIQSSNYVPGVSGWRIHGDGSAELAAASIRGKLTANQIDGEGLAIKQGGVVILGAGNALSWDNVQASSRPRMIEAVSEGYQDPSTPSRIPAPRSSGIYVDGVNVKSPYWWGFAVLNDDLTVFDHWGIGPGSTDPDTAASWLWNYINNGSKRIVAVCTNDHPTGMYSQSLLNALFKCGASRGGLGSSSFLGTYRGAYSLIGRFNSPEGSGVESLSREQSRFSVASAVVRGGAIIGSQKDIQITSGNASTYIANAAIGAAQIGSLSVGVLSTTMNGGSSEGIRMETNKLMVFSGGQEVVRVGYLY